MIANYHTHTARCRHAEGMEADYVKMAAERGLQVLGMSDHTPYPFPEGYYSYMRMYPQELANYCKAVEDLKQEYKGRLQVHLGLEAEYYPALFSELLRILRDQNIEYLILGQHWPGNEMNEVYGGRPTEDESVLQRYYDQCIEALQTGVYTYMAHPDLARFTGPVEIFQKHAARLCREAKSCGVPLEVNLLGIRQQRHYPNIRFWEMAAQEGCQVVFGCDAHKPEDVTDPASEKVALELIGSLGLELLETVELRKV